MQGVGGAPVRRVEHGGFTFFFSETTETDVAPRDIVRAAQQVHAVVSEIFSRSPVLPFRYPTVFAGENEFQDLARTRGDRFCDYFERVGSKVQMDVRLTISAEDQTSQEDLHPPGTEEGRVGPAANLGRSYLEARARCQAQLSAAAEKCRQTAGSAEWRIQRRGENIHCQALISRVEVVSFFERMRALQLPGGIKAGVSGPWPPAGFWEDKSR